MAFTWVIKKLHAAHTLEDSSWHDVVPFHSFFLMDDQVLVEPHIGLRAPVSVALAEACAAKILGPEAINLKKDAEEGCLEIYKIAWGLAYDTESETRELPKVKLEKATHLLHDESYDYGNLHSTLLSWQELRGNQEFWTTVLPSITGVPRYTNKMLGQQTKQAEQCLKERRKPKLAPS